METNEVRVGDTVYLNSGSPALIVTEVIVPQVKVTWDSGDGILSHIFPVASVTHVITPYVHYDQR
jgi:uncharacterized protein YodC (DUF2158 family)